MFDEICIIVDLFVFFVLLYYFVVIIELNDVFYNGVIWVGLFSMLMWVNMFVICWCCVIMLGVIGSNV